MPVGSLVWYFGPTPPLGYLVCDGSTVNQSDYPALFQVIGTIYGPADTTVFTLPNMLGAFVRGWNNGGSGPDNGRVFGSHQLQSTAAPVAQVTISAETMSAGEHFHYLLDRNGNPFADKPGWDNLYDTNGQGQGTSQGGLTSTGFVYDGKPYTGNAGVHQHALNGPATLTGGDPETRPYNIALLPCIKF